MSSSSQVVVVITLVVKPGKEDVALAACEAAIGKTHDEAGCLSYALHRDLDEPRRFVLVERWTSSVAMESHTQQPYVAELYASAADLLDEPPTLHRTSPVPMGDPMKGVL
jgi:quinol monooxygenase YgiN